MSAAIAGSEVAMTVESMFSMNKATATISGTMRLAGMGIWSLKTARGSKPCADGSRIVPGTGKQALWWRKHNLDEERLLLLGRSPR